MAHGITARESEKTYPAVKSASVRLSLDTDGPLRATAAAPGVRLAGRVAALSYRWLAAPHPDPDGWHMARVIHYVRRQHGGVLEVRAARADGALDAVPALHGKCRRRGLSRGRWRAMGRWQGGVAVDAVLAAALAQQLLERGGDL